MTRFQIIFTGFLVACGVVGIILFAMVKNTTTERAPALVMWGTIKKDTMERFIGDVTKNYEDILNITYVEKTPANFESDLVAALARGSGPDMVLLPQDLLLSQADKFYPIPYGNFSQRLFKDSFIQQGEMYLTKEGIIGLPFSVDPLVMYWNRDIFTQAGQSLPPNTWTDVLALAPKIIKKDSAGNITQALVAFGEMRNVLRAKEVLSLLILQAGNPIVSRNTQGGLMSVIAERGAGLSPAEQALSYFVEFSNPNKSVYSWNRALSNDRTLFTSGKLALYFGYASEVDTIRSANPNLNFDVARVPQVEGNKATFGSMTALTLLKSSKYIPGAYAAAQVLTSSPVQSAWIEFSNYPPVRRELVTTVPQDAYKTVFYESALISRGWLDPSRALTLDVFSRMVDNVTSGRMRVSESVSQANLELSDIIRTLGN